MKQSVGLISYETRSLKSSVVQYETFDCYNRPNPSGFTENLDTIKVGVFLIDERNGSFCVLNCGVLLWLCRFVGHTIGVTLQGVDLTQPRSQRAAPTILNLSLLALPRGTAWHLYQSDKTYTQKCMIYLLNRLPIQLGYKLGLELSLYQNVYRQFGGA